MSQELERLREQSRIALEQTGARVEALRDEGERISEELMEKERKLQELRLLRKPSSSAHGRLDMVDDSEISGRSSSLGQASNRYDNESKSSRGEFQLDEEDVRIQLMIQARDEEVMEIKSSLNEKENLLKSLHKETAAQQETIHELQRALEDRETESGLALEAKVREKENDIADLEEELGTILESLSSTQKSHFELEEEWNEREDLVADAEAEAADRGKDLKTKLDQYTLDLARKKEAYSSILQESSETLEGMRQDLMDHLGPDTSHNLMNDLRKSLETLQEKEDELAKVLLRRLHDRRCFGRITKKLAKRSNDAARAIRHLADLQEMLDDQAAGSPEQDPEDLEDVEDAVDAIQDQIALAFDDATQELMSRLDRVEQLVMGMSDSDSEEESERVSVDLVKRNVEKLRFTIQAKFRQIQRVLPERVEPSRRRRRRSSSRLVSGGKAELQIDSLQLTLDHKKDELRGIHDDLLTLEKKAEKDIAKATKRVEVFEKHVQFMIDGLIEKDRIKDGILEIIKERRDAEVELLEELEYVYRNGIIDETDFQESEQYLLDKVLQAKKGRAKSRD